MSNEAQNMNGVLVAYGRLVSFTARRAELWLRAQGYVVESGEVNSSSVAMDKYLEYGDIILSYRGDDIVFPRELLDMSDEEYASKIAEITTEREDRIAEAHRVQTALQEEAAQRQKRRRLEQQEAEAAQKITYLKSVIGCTGDKEGPTIDISLPSCYGCKFLVGDPKTFHTSTCSHPKAVENQPIVPNKALVCGDTIDMEGSGIIGRVIGYNGHRPPDFCPYTQAAQSQALRIVAISTEVLPIDTEHPRRDLGLRPCADCPRTSAYCSSNMFHRHLCELGNEELFTLMVITRSATQLAEANNSVNPRAAMIKALQVS